MLSPGSTESRDRDHPFPLSLWHRISLYSWSCLVLLGAEASSTLISGGETRRLHVREPNVPHLQPIDPNAMSANEACSAVDRSPDAGGLRIRLNQVVSLGVAAFAALFVLVTVGHQVIDSLLVRFEQSRSVHRDRSTFAGPARP